MRTSILAALAALAVPLTAVANPDMSCPITCKKTASPMLVTSAAPDVTQVTYTVEMWSDSGDGTYCDNYFKGFSDTLLAPNPWPADYERLLVSGVPQTLTYTLDLNYEICKALPGAVLGLDGKTVNLTNTFSGQNMRNGFMVDCSVTIQCVPPEPPPQGCTRTPGYWQTHSEFGPAPYDATWASLADGASTAFFRSGGSYYAAISASSAGGSAYYILAQAYIAAVLNGYAGASVPEDVATALEAAEAFFAARAPGDALTKPQSGAAKAWAALLDAYNNGTVGPGHCAD